MSATKAKTKAMPQGKRPPREADLESFRDISDDVIESDFVPFAGLYDPSTIATKNGELMQVIKVTGLGFEALAHGDLRAAIRTAITTCIPDTSYAIWMHTLRRRQSIMAESKFPDSFSSEIDTAWRALHPNSASFVNELYVTIVKAGQQAGLTNLDALVQSLWPPRDLTVRREYMDIALRDLTATTGRMLQVLQPYGARLLTVVERNQAFYSEQIEFLEKLINLTERPMPVPLRDLSQVLTSSDITFGFNAMEVRNADGQRRFATILTLKEYKESTLAGIDKFLDIPCELIVSQCFDFVHADQAREAYETQARYLASSGDRELAGWMEIDRLTQGKFTERSYGEQQTTLFLIAPSIRQLEANVKLAQKALARLGMVVIREDLRFEECYWAQLPGNFPFLSRQHSVDTSHLAGFANLQTQPIGNAAGSHWGPPVTLLSTVQDAPYFFNFQRSDGTQSTGHTLILGRPKSGRTTFAHFLLAQARRLPADIWYLDMHGRAQRFITALGGRYVTPGTPQCRLNPLALDDTPTNREFLALWLTTLIDPKGTQLTRSLVDFFASLIERFIQRPAGERRLSTLLPLVREADPMLAAALKPFCAGGTYGELFDMPTDELTLSEVCGWNLAPWAGNPATLVPLASYMLHCFTEALDGYPAILVLDEGFQLLDNPLYASRAAQWFDHLNANEAVAILMTEHIEDSAALSFTPALAAKASSIFVTTDSDPVADYAFGFGLSEQDMATLAYMDRSAHHVLLKRGGESTLLKANLTSLGPLLATLHGRSAQSQQTTVDFLAELTGGAVGATA